MNDNLDPKEIRNDLNQELADIKMDDKLQWRILGQYRSVAFKRGGRIRKKIKYVSVLAAVLCIALLTPIVLFTFSNSGAFKSYMQSGIDDKKIALGMIPTVDSAEKLIELVSKGAGLPSVNYHAPNVMVSEAKGVMNAPMAPALPETKNTINAVDSSGVQGVQDYSSTNVQVAGVDEGDIVKTDGKYIYSLSNNLKYPSGMAVFNCTLTIIEAMPDGKLKQVSRIDTESRSAANELYVDDSTVSILFNSVPDGQKSYSKVLLYGIADRTKPELLKKFQIEGNYLSTRKIGNIIYLVTNKYIQITSDTTNPQMQPPAVCDSIYDNKFNNISYSDVKYFPDENYQTYVSISSIDTSKPGQDAKINTFLSSGQNIYCSLNNLYIANTMYEIQPLNGNGIIGSSMSGRSTPVSSSRSFEVHMFSLDNGNVVYKAKTDKITGYILNQYSMDEYNGYFRVAATDGGNSLYVFDANMKKTGEIKDMATGEQIKSVRFMGDKGYVVTFRQTDPLFVIDLTQPAAPKVLGQLKIPGFSEYLHPYDANHLIGVGKSAGDTGRVTGLKMSLFDVTDPLNPKEMFTRDIGEGLPNPANFTGQNPKSFLFDKEKGIIALPVTSYSQTSDRPVTANYINVYSVDLNNGFILKAKILANEQTVNSMYYNRMDDARALYIKDKFYTTTNNLIKSFDYSTFNQIDALQIAGQ